MSTITVNNPNNPTPQPQQQQQGFHQCHACGRGVLGGNQSSNYGGNQYGNYGGNQSGNYGGNQFGNYDGNQSSNYSGNQSGNYGGNQFGNYGKNVRPNYQNNRSNYQNRFNNRNQNGNYRSRSRSPYHNSGRRSYQRTYYNRNYRSQRPRQYNNNRRGNYRGNFRNNNYQRQYYQPRPITMGDFVPQQLQNGQNLPVQIINEIPSNALPQRSQFVNNNTTQPFVVQQDNQNYQIQPQGQQYQRTRTTSSHRRRERRQQQQQNRQNKINNNNNRFAVLAEEQGMTDDEEENINYDNQINKTNKKNKKSKTKIRSYLNHNRVLNYFKNKNNKNLPKEFSELLENNRACDGVENFLINSAPVYDEQIRAEYELQVWQNYLKLGKEYKHWTKEVVQRTKKRDDNVNIRFVDKKTNQLTSTILQTRATLSRLQIEFGDYWAQITTRKKYVDKNTGSNTTTSISTSNPRINFELEQFEKVMSNYIEDCLKHVKKMCDRRILLAKAQMEEYKALEEFEKISTAPHKIIHLVLKPKIKIWSIKSKNFHMAQKRLDSNLLPKFITKIDLSFKIDESILKQDDIQTIYNDMHQIKNEFYRKSMELYSRVASTEFDMIKNEIETIIEENRPDTLFITQNDDDVNLNDAQRLSQDNNKEDKSYAAFEHYHQLRIKRLNLEAEQSSTATTTSRYCPDSFIIGPNIINEAPQIKLTEEEYQLLNLGPRFIFNDPKTAARRRITELATLRRKIETRFHEKKVSPGRPVQQFIAELDILLQNLHNSSSSITTNCRQINQITSQNTSFIIPDDLIISSQSQTNTRLIKKKKNYHRLIKRLKYKFRLTNTILRKTDKSKVFHLGKLQNYEKGSEEYMNKTNAYACLGTEDPLPNLLQRTNQYLLNLRLAKWITQKQYEQLCVQVDEVELAHLYYLPKAHKPGTPLRPIISGLKHPTIKISKFLDDLLRPLFDKMALNTTVMSGFELVKKLQEWSQVNMKKETILCTVDVADLYTMIPQVEGVLALKKMLDFLHIKQIKELKVEAIIRLARFVMQNNYFKYNGQYYHQIRGGAMGSPLTLTIANCYMFFYERDIVRQISNSGGLYLRYIDDLFIIINWPVRHFIKQIDRWNKFDENIKLSANINSYADFLDVHMENRDGQLFTTVYYKPSYEPYYLPYNSVHPTHMKKNIAFAMLLRAIRYCSTFDAYIKERISN
ncbi:unnamed protein product [Rotaria sordida]|uniref:Reverse transcriptase domain-containing protein n=1 Tax=Rotaria sordida TaxID=392033 RepID=A0A819NTA3_9BILA|nr:unnamed protein product [Rotaria sordida]